MPYQLWILPGVCLILAVYYNNMQANAITVDLTVEETEEVDESMEEAKDVSLRVIDGEPSKKDVVQYMTTVYISQKMTAVAQSHHILVYKYAGGGVLINPEYVLTAAMIIYKKKPTQFLIGLGTYSLQKEATPRLVNVYNVIVHYAFPWTVHQLANDIGLLELAVRVVTDQLVSIPEFDMAGVPTENCFITGHGSTMMSNITATAENITPPATFSVTPQTAAVVLQSEEDCPLVKMGDYCGVKKNTTAANALKGGTACKGDEGSPVLCAGPDDHLYLVAVISHASCGQTDIYTSTIFHHKWIKDVIQGKPQPDLSKLVKQSEVYGSEKI